LRRTLLNRPEQILGTHPDSTAGMTTCASVDHDAILNRVCEIERASTGILEAKPVDSILDE
jgi:hypothetical protein